MIRLNNVSKTVTSGSEKLTILHAVYLTIAKGQFVAVVGPSGSGKSTLVQWLTAAVALASADTGLSCSMAIIAGNTARICSANSGYRSRYSAARVGSRAAVSASVGLAYGELAGLPMAGLYGSLLPLVAYALFGSSRLVVVGPDSAMAALVAVAVAPLAMGDGSRLAMLCAGLGVLEYA